MTGPPRPLDRSRLLRLLSDEPFVTRLELVGTIGSTNDRARSLADAGAPGGTVVIAEAQTAGRGRLGRSWQSDRGLGLYVSVLLRPEVPVVETTRWTLATAVAACEACRATCDAAIEIKWPNDLLWRGRKLGGVLAELRSSGARASDLVIGVGLNLGQHADDFPDELSSSATSLRQAVAGAAPDREHVAASFLRRLGAIAGLLDRGDWPAVARRWESLAPGAFGQRVRITPPVERGEPYEGVTSGLDELGALRVRRGDGATDSVRLAEAVAPLEARDALGR